MVLGYLLRRTAACGMCNSRVLNFYLLLTSATLAHSKEIHGINRFARDSTTTQGSSAIHTTAHSNNNDNSHSNNNHCYSNGKQNTNKMPEKRIAPVISSLDDFELNLPGYLNSNKTLSMLVDYDGTLAPIASNPNKTFMTVDSEMLLNKIAKNPKIFMAVISGRGLRDVQSRVGISGITYAGNHGLEIEKPDGTRHDYELPDAIKQNYLKLVKELRDNVQKNNAFVEDKRVSLTYHYRDTPLDIKEQQRQLAVKIIEKHGFRANQAHEAIEAKPPVNWNKGEAALYILKNKFGPNWAERTKIIFAGDDATDEDAMRVLQGVGRTFRISTDPDIQTFADFRLARQDVVKDLLQWISNAYKA